MAERPSRTAHNPPSTTIGPDPDSRATPSLRGRGRAICGRCPGGADRRGEMGQLGLRSAKAGPRAGVGGWQTPTLWLDPPQIFLLACLFGWRLRADPTRRRFTTLYWELGRKGAKSTLMAAIALYHLLEEGEPGPQVIW